MADAPFKPEARVDVTPKGIVVRAYRRHFDLIRPLEGAVYWSGDAAWYLPATANSARSVYGALAQVATEWSEYFMQLLGVEDKRTDPVVSVLPSIPLVNSEPWPHQIEGYWFTKGRPFGMLAMDMGTGKSRIVVDIVVNEGHGKTLILAPVSVLDAWEKQFRVHAARPVRVLIAKKGTGLERAARIREFLQGSEPAVVVTNYDIAWQGPMETVLLNVKWDLVVLDESHRIKAPGGVTSRFCQRLGKSAKKRLCLTGTPMPHSPLDLYAQFRFLDTAVFGSSFVSFRNRYAIMGGFKNREVLRFVNQDDLTARLARHSFRVPKSVLNLLPPVDVTHTFELSKEADRIYRDLEDEFVAEVGSGIVTVANALTKLLKFQQLTSGFIGDDEGVDREVDDGKAKLLKDILEDLDASEPVVVFARFHHDLDRIGKVAESVGRSWSELSGRSDELMEWQRGETNLIAVQIQTGGAGIDLTRAAYCFYFSIGFSLGDYDQSRARLDRPGQTRPVTYYHLMAKATVDEKVYAALAKRADVIRAILEAAQREQRLSGGTGAALSTEGDVDE